MITDKTASKGTVELSLTSAMQSLDYVNLVDIEEPVCISVEPGEDIEVSVNAGGSFRNHYVYVDYDGDGFTASIAEGSDWKPAGDIVAYSFYNNNAASDENGWNSTGKAISGGDRSKPALPAFTAPANSGVYRVRFKQDWCNIDPMGDADGKFGDFKQNGGQIIDALLVVGSPETGIENVKGESGKREGLYDLTGRKLENIMTPGVYIVNGKKVLVK